MDIKPVVPGNISSEGKSFTFSVVTRSGEETREVAADKYELASRIDSDENCRLTDLEIKAYLRQQDILRDPSKFDVDEESIIRSFKHTLEGNRLPQINQYLSYDEMVDVMKALTEAKPEICEMVSLGTTFEGRDIWALKVSKKDESSKPGVVVTGLTHAREWISGAVPMYAMRMMVDGYDSDPALGQIVNNSETWFVPCLNPDGYEYSRTQDSWWRKNRRDFTRETMEMLADSGGISEFPSQTQRIEGADPSSGEAGEPVDLEALKWGSFEKIGVDLNRNYWDENPAHYHLYRPPGDSPDSTSDDKGASDRITSETYRGPEGASEKETQAIQSLEMKNRNIKAVIDYHAYGNMILYPWGYTYDTIENRDQYRGIASGMQKAILDADEDKVHFRVMQSSDLYPSTGSSEDFQAANGILGFTIELGRSFAPVAREIESIAKRTFEAQKYLTSYVIENADSIRPEKSA